MNPAGHARAGRPEGVPTRGTTHPNRLRRVDRWLLREARRNLLQAADPLVVDLGFGHAHWTTNELAHRLARLRADVEVTGLEIDPARVAAAAGHADPPRLRFAVGGFELDLDGRRTVLVRAFNVLRQYDEPAAWAAWARMTGRLAPGGLLVEGTCDELGRRASWVALDRDGPRSLTLAAHLGSLGSPAELAARLPKVLIHRNVPGRPVHALLAALQRAWAAAAPYSVFGPRQRWVAAVDLLRVAGWPVLSDSRAARHGELTVPWEVVAD